jgi:16S rRNA (adenine1518-N6/adenine1519-N6)-dimethyltransferase
MKPKKHLGQNFLQDKAPLGKIVGALAIKSGETVVEIGPGHGELTKELLRYPINVVAIEKDVRLVSFLNKNFQFPISNFQSSSKSQFSKLQIISGDVLKVLPEIIQNSKLKIQNSSYKLAGNIPYYITGHLLRILSELDQKPKCIVLTVQKEVAERLCAAPPKMNLLAASVQFWAKPEIVGYIGRGDFHPAPKVDSAIIRLIPIGKTLMDPNVFYPLIRPLFKQPRKTVVNNLLETGKAKIVIEQKLKAAGINSGSRPQQLSMDQIRAFVLSTVV